MTPTTSSTSTTTSRPSADSPDELAVHASGASDLTRPCRLMADGRLDGQIELEGSWREPGRALDAHLERRVGGKAVLHVD